MATLLQRVRRRAAADIKRASLELRRRRGQDFVDYGWMRLLYSGDGDEQEISYHLNQREWHEKDLAIFRSLLAPGHAAIDVGANLGFVSTMLASIVGPGGRVISFEPSPTVFHKLERTIALNGLDQVLALNLGCGDATSRQTLHDVGDSSGNASILADGDGPATTIDVVRLDDVAEVWEQPIRLLKIDTEGYEPKVLVGAARLLEAQRPVVYLEMGGDYLDSTRESIRILDGAGYDVSHVTETDWHTVGNGSDYFFLPRGV